MGHLQARRAEVVTNPTRSERIPGPPNPPAEPELVGNCPACGMGATAHHRCLPSKGPVEIAQMVDALRLAWSCLLEVRRDFDAPINNVIAEVEAALGIDRGANPS